MDMELRGAMFCHFHLYFYMSEDLKRQQLMVRTKKQLIIAILSVMDYGKVGVQQKKVPRDDGQNSMG